MTSWKLPLVLSLLATSGCGHLERKTPLAVAKCGLEVGKSCQTRLMGWVGRDEVQWAQGCKVSDNDFCAWCAVSGDPIFYPKGSRQKESDCK